jgi:hypothetical protein
VCDAYEAMTAERPYRERMSTGDARRELRDHAGTQFDPEVVDAFLTATDPDRTAPADDRTRSAIDTAAGHIRRLLHQHEPPTAATEDVLVSAPRPIVQH